MTSRSCCFFSALPRSVLKLVRLMGWDALLTLFDSWLILEKTTLVFDVRVLFVFSQGEPFLFSGHASQVPRVRFFDTMLRGF